MLIYYVSFDTSTPVAVVLVVPVSESRSNPPCGWSAPHTTDPYSHFAVTSPMKTAGLRMGAINIKSKLNNNIQYIGNVLYTIRQQIKKI